MPNRETTIGDLGLCGHLRDEFRLGHGDSSLGFGWLIPPDSGLFNGELGGKRMTGVMREVFVSSGIR